ncbi:MAG: hypothetical protein IJE14_08860 [Clostridia bacterium]|nr:hypothetical protein [Clostridia bacterium]
MIYNLTLTTPRQTAICTIKKSSPAVRSGLKYIWCLVCCCIGYRDKTVEYADVEYAVGADCNRAVAVVPVPADACEYLKYGFARLKVNSGQVPCNLAFGDTVVIAVLGIVILSCVEVNETVLCGELGNNRAGGFVAFPCDEGVCAISVEVYSYNSGLAGRVCYKEARAAFGVVVFNNERTAVSNKAVFADTLAFGEYGNLCYDIAVFTVVYTYVNLFIGVVCDCNNLLDAAV